MNNLFIYFNLFLFCFISSITPGPNNIILIISTHRVGIIRSMPILLGIVIGFSTMLIFSKYISVILLNNIYIHSILLVLSTIFILYICYSIYTLDVNATLTKYENIKYFNFLTVFLFQIINPKAWIFSMAAASVYIKNDMGYMAVFITTFIASILGCLPWLLLGSNLDKLLNTKIKKSIFFKTMSIILFLTTLYSILESV